MKHTKYALNKTWKAVLRDADLFRPFMVAGFTGGGIGAAIAGVLIVGVVVPHIKDNARLNAENHAYAAIEGARERSYSQGALDLLEGRITVQEEFERAFVLIRRDDGQTDRLPLDHAGRENIKREGWTIRPPFDRPPNIIANDR